MCRRIDEACSIWRALDLLGDWATLLVLESYWLGARRFSEFQSLTGLPKTVLSGRLKTLVTSGCLKKRAYSVKPPRSEYSGTAKLRALFPAALAMFGWEQRWGKQSGKLKISLRHKVCGQSTVPLPVCGHCGNGLDARDCRWAPGPGAGLIYANYSRRRRRAATPARSGLLDSCFEVIGDRWSGLILHSVFCGSNQYDDLLGATRAATNILADRLQRLQQAGILRRQPYQTSPPRFAYRLTDKGLALYPVLVALLTWGDQYYPASKGPPVLLSHRACAAPLNLAFACSACQQRLELGSIEQQITGHEVSAAGRPLEPLPV